MKDFVPAFTGKWKKRQTKELLPLGIKQLATFQDVLYDQNIYALLLIFQVMDAAGKDSTIKPVMSGIHP